MNQNPTTTADSARKTYANLLGTLAEMGSSWAVYGLKVGKMALETSAETLGKTAHTLDVLAAELDKKAKHAAEPKPEEAPRDGVASGDGTPQA